MPVERFTPEDPYSPPNIPVDDMNNTSYVRNNKLYPVLPLPWYPVDSGDTRDRFDLRVLPDTELATLGFTPAPAMPTYNAETHYVEWSEDTGNWVILEIPTPAE